MLGRYISAVIFLLIMLALANSTNGCTSNTATPETQEQTDSVVLRLDYSKAENWAYYEANGSRPADCLLINPTSECTDNTIANIDVNNPKHRRGFVSSLNMERHIYDGCANMYAPFYRSAALCAYYNAPPIRQKAFALAYQDVADAIDYYLRHSKPERPLILAGFSQGSEHLLQYLQEKGNNPELQSRLVAVYAIGWHFTPEEVDPYPWIRMAQSADDIGTVISFECEAADVPSSLIVPPGKFTYSINPLVWNTDKRLADKSFNKGAYFFDSEGNISKKTANMTGCYIDSKRGTLICPDVDSEQYPGVIFPKGRYHIYDYMFFCNNLRENVKVRLNAFCRRKATTALPACLMGRVPC